MLHGLHRQLNVRGDQCIQIRREDFVKAPLAAQSHGAKAEVLGTLVTRMNCRYFKGS